MRRLRPLRRGSAGRTHCGQSTRHVPEDLPVTKLVCTDSPGHRGRHFNRWSGYEWAPGEEPSKRPGVFPPRGPD